MPPTANDRSCPATSWPLERVLFAVAGTVTLVSVGLAAAVSPWFLLLTAFVGLNQWLFVIVGACPMSVLLTRGFGRVSAASSTAPRAPVAR